MTKRATPDPHDRADETGPAPDWPPAGSAFNHSEGHQQRGSTGQLFEVRGGRWVRVPEPAPTRSYAGGCNGPAI